MSYDVYLEISTGGPEPADVFWRNMTSNVAPMWIRAGADLGAMGDARMRGDEVAPILRRAIREMAENPSVYRAMNPANGWGDYASCAEFLSTLADACEANPLCYLRVSR